MFDTVEFIVVYVFYIEMGCIYKNIVSRSKSP